MAPKPPMEASNSLASMPLFLINEAIPLTFGYY